MKGWRWLCYAVVLFQLRCGTVTPGNESKPLFRLMPDCGINFINTVTSTPQFNVFNYRNFYNGGGCAIGDLNNDGLADVFMTANEGSNKLYLNEGNFRFKDITASSNTADSTSWSTGVALVDINADGWLDIYVCNAGYIGGKAPESRMYINNHNLTFTDQAATYNLQNIGGYATHAAFFDYDNDGDLDCFIVNNSFIPTNTLNYENKRNLRAQDWPVKDFLKGGGDRLLKNVGGHFEDVSEAAGIYGSLISFGLGVTVGDVNNDGWLDVYVSNDFFERDYLYINQHDGTFRDQLVDRIQHTSHSSMGADMADINNDGLPDIFTTEMLPDDNYRLKTTSSFESIDVNRKKIKSGFYYQYMQNTLQVNNGSGNFMETAFYSGVAASDWSWGGLIFDADNDGQQDIFVSNGIYKDVTDQDFIDFFADEVYQKMAISGEKAAVDKIMAKMPSVPLPNKMFVNKRNAKFEEKAEAWGLATPSFSNGAAYGDLDNDGDLDLVVNNVNQQCFAYQNQSRQNNQQHFLAIQLRAAGSNRFAIGSKINIYTKGEVISRELLPTRGFQSSVDYKIVAGLGERATVDSLVIIWSNRTCSVIAHPAIDTLLQYEQPDNAPLYHFNSPAANPLFIELNSAFDRHREDDFVDFYTERNIPAMLSREGPRAAIGDVNGDKLDDVYICGASGFPGRLYFQTADGQFKMQSVADFELAASQEGTAAAFFDADSDGDLDLVVAQGGNNQPANSAEYTCRLYLNNGKGVFSAAVNALPVTDNISCVLTIDIELDGDLDLILTNRGVPGNYGVTGNSLVLINDGKGNFTNAPAAMCDVVNKAGLISGAAWCNLNRGTNKDLVLVGEWMSPRVFRFDGKRFYEQATNLQQLQGLWQTVTAADFDNDGDDDLILGNIGENFYLHPSAGSPAKLWINDFDGNGTLDKIITSTVNKADLPVFTRKDLSDQLPGLKKQNLRHADYANKPLQQLFAEEAKNATVKTFNFTSSVVAINKGGGTFDILPLPWQVQLSCVNKLLAADIDKDGDLDLLVGGNKYDLLPQFCRLDASMGAALLNNGKGVFTYLANSKSGIQVKGCVRDIRQLNVSGVPCFLWLRNDDYPVLYSFDTNQQKIKHLIKRVSGNKH